jgi:hypothetical protein
MSRLYYSEEGRVLPGHCEELTRFRHARKHLDLPETSEPAQVWILARAYPEGQSPLRVAVNGTQIAAIDPVRPGAWHWHCIDVDAQDLLAGSNHFDLWTDGSAMDGWSLALEAGHAHPDSELSDDGGLSWRRERMGYLNTVLAEYVVRVRLVEGEDPTPAQVVWEDRLAPRLASLRARVPATARGDGPVLQRARALSTWLASSWEHTGSNRAEQYTPWDAETLLAWAPGQKGHNGKRPIAMCVHYAAALVSSAQAVGIPARCAVLTEAVNGMAGHFVAEIWEPDLGKWVVVDPNADAMFISDGEPMSMTQIQQAGSDIGGMIEWGPGTEFQLSFPHIVEFAENNLKQGVCFQHRSVWHRADLLTAPWMSPPGHGSLSYCETGLVWEQRDLARGFGMFPAFGDSDWFDAAPAGWD